VLARIQTARQQLPDLAPLFPRRSANSCCRWEKSLGTTHRRRTAGPACRPARYCVSRWPWGHGGKSWLGCPVARRLAPSYLRTAVDAVAPVWSK